MSFIVIIPARFYSSRLPGKPLVDIHSKPMVIRVMENALASSAERVIVATDHINVVKSVKKFGGEVCLTSNNHKSGIERIEEVISYYNISDEKIIVNVQVDEPMISATIIDKVAKNLSFFENSNITTIAIPILSKKDAFDINKVKIVIDINGYALYFSRAPIPWDKNNYKFFSNYNHIHNNYLRHIGIYAYKSGFIRNYITLPVSPLEQIENLEQLRALWYGKKIHVDIIKNMISNLISVDTLEDLNQIKSSFDSTF